MSEGTDCTSGAPVLSNELKDLLKDTRFSPQDLTFNASQPLDAFYRVLLAQIEGAQARAELLSVWGIDGDAAAKSDPQYWQRVENQAAVDAFLLDRCKRDVLSLYIFDGDRFWRLPSDDFDIPDCLDWESTFSTGTMRQGIGTIRGWAKIELLQLRIFVTDSDQQRAIADLEGLKRYAAKRHRESLPTLTDDELWRIVLDKFGRPPSQADGAKIVRKYRDITDLNARAWIKARTGGLKQGRHRTS